MQAILDTLAFLRRWAQALGPYLLLELLMPGGSLLALGLFLYRNGKPGAEFTKLKFVGLLPRSPLRLRRQHFLSPTAPNDYGAIGRGGAGLTRSGFLGW